MSLRTKTTLLLAFLVTLALLGGGGMLLHYQERALKEGVFKGAEAISDVLAHAISTVVGDRLYEAQAVANSLPREAIVQRDTVAIERYLKHALDFYPKFESGMFVLDKDGVFVADYPSHPELRGESLAYRQYFQRSATEGRGVLGDPYRSERSGRPVLTYTGVIRDAGGDIIGYVACSTDLLAPSALGSIRNQRLGQSGYIYVIDKSRLMILHPLESRVLQRDVALGANRLLDEALVQGFKEVQGAGGEYRRTGETVNSSGQPMLVAFRRIPQTDWLIGVQQPKSEAFEAIVEARWRVVIFLVVCVVLVCGVGVVAVRRLTRPLTRLHQVAQQVGDQLETAQVHTVNVEARELLGQIQSNDELGQLTRVFSRLLDQLDTAMVATQSAARGLRESNAELQRMNEQLLQAQGQIIQSEKLASLGQLAAGVAHEINNPIGFVSSNMESLEKYLGDLFAMIAAYEQAIAPLSGRTEVQHLAARYEALEIDFLREDASALLRESKEGLQRVTQIVQDLRNFSQIDTQEGWQTVDLRQCINSALNLAHHAIDATADVTIHYAALPEIECLPAQINQVAMNLLLNAVDAVDAACQQGKQRGKITVSTGVEGERVWFEVADNGCGVDAAWEHKIFDPFFTTKPIGQGVGLGLSLSYGIVQQHGGDIQVRSKPGEGAVFRVTLPIRRSEVT